MFYILRNSFIIITGSTIWHRIASVLHYRWKEGSSSPSYVNSGETVGSPYWVGVPSSDISSAGSPFFFCGGSKHGVGRVQWKEGCSPSCVNPGRIGGSPYWAGVPGPIFLLLGPHMQQHGVGRLHCSGKKSAFHLGSTLADSGLPHLQLGCRVPY